MPSLFPGMDPFLAGQEWEDFHATFHATLREFLSPRVEPQYVVRVERRVYVESFNSDSPESRRADVAILKPEMSDFRIRPQSSEFESVAAVECLVPMPEEHREAYLVIRHRKTMEVVTVIETLSPANKRRGSDGRREYLSKREMILHSPTHMVELDLLRGGARLPMSDPLPPGDYYAIVTRAERRPRASVYAWPLLHTLPTIPVPLKQPDPDVPLELQDVFNTVYDRARYHLTLRYKEPLDPPLDQPTCQWLEQQQRQ